IHLLRNNPSPEPNALPPPHRRSNKQHSDFDPLNPNLLEDVKSLLINQYDGSLKRNGWLASRCPYYHEQDRTGRHFNYHPELGIAHCHGKHGRIYLKDLCQQLGIDLTPYGGTIYLKRGASTRG